ncbi:hypothetical protein CLV68_3994 [Actinokineospora cianjurensis]|uniref:Uncharacterized protein n=1 Tax=Actinokineospora cianjurensis TaxID=585224 RepID=A0A421B5B9_9PSEU|nr:hypothetical protein CLV68_3994 [Actinokineospora cianjurensis]
MVAGPGFALGERWCGAGTERSARSGRSCPLDLGRHAGVVTAVAASTRLN